MVAGVEIELEHGWKTYWRNPGTSGVPPRMEWSESDNVAEAKLLFPAPHRFQERDGDTIGYKTAVVLPVAVTAKDPAKPIKLKLALEYGVCKDVCVPVQPTLELAIPADAAGKGLAKGLAAALDLVPREAGHRRASDPVLSRVDVALAGPKPKFELMATFATPEAARGGDVFLEAPDGLWVPLPKPVGEPSGLVRRFEVDLTDGADIAELKGKRIRVTLVAPGGQSETSFELQ